MNEDFVEKWVFYDRKDEFLNRNFRNLLLVSMLYLIKEKV